jgi:hypothetical protein
MDWGAIGTILLLFGIIFAAYLIGVAHGRRNRM